MCFSLRTSYSGLKKNVSFRKSSKVQTKPSHRFLYHSFVKPFKADANIQLCMQQPQKRCEQETVQSTVMERGAGAASLATANNAVLFFHKAVLFRALFGNSMTTHMQSASRDTCGPPGLFSPRLIFHPPRPPQPRSVPYVHYFMSRDIQARPHTVSVCLSPLLPKVTKHFCGSCFSSILELALKAAAMTRLARSL